MKLEFEETTDQLSRLWLRRYCRAGTLMIERPVVQSLAAVHIFISALGQDNELRSV